MLKILLIALLSAVDLDSSGPACLATAFRVQTQELDLNEATQKIAMEQEKSETVLVAADPKKKKKGLLKRMAAWFKRGGKGKVPPPNPQYSVRWAKVATGQVVRKKILHGHKVKYFVHEKLGEGGFGKVYRATDKAQNRFAIKIIENVASTELASEDFEEEIDTQALARGDAVEGFPKGKHNPFVPKNFEHFRVGEDFYIVMELVQGVEVWDVINSYELTEEQIRAIFKQMVMAIDNCHKNGVAHRDIKLENMMLDPHKFGTSLKVIDFGLAAHMTKGSEAKQSKKEGKFPLLFNRFGTPIYSSPEILTGRAYTGPEVDNWSLGVTLYAMLTRRLPFDDASMSQLTAAVLKAKYRWPSKIYISKDAKAVVEMLLTVNPRKRMDLNKVKMSAWFSKP